MRRLKRVLATALAAVVGLSTVSTGSVLKVKAAENEYNYAKLLQYSLYLYDANMCGSDVGEKSLHAWRDDCHTFDVTTYTRMDGVTVNVDVTGGYHDAGDHVKFGLPEAYAAFVLGMSYDTEKDAYSYAGQAGHLKTITTRFADYLKKCAVYDAYGNVEAYCVQVGMGGGGYDHGYWGPPEKQTNANRPIYFATVSEPSTDIVALSAAALAMQYKNFGGADNLEAAKKIFDFARRNNKACNTTASYFYSSSAWQDDYCLAAIMLYNITGEQIYLNEFNTYKNHDKSQNCYWPLCWDNVGPAVAYYNGNSGSLANYQYIGGSTIDGVYKCVDDWGSARYNTALQYMGLILDSMTGTASNQSWAESQMQYLLGNNPRNQSYVIGYNNGPKYPHHRAASGYEGSVQGTRQQANVLLGALVGGLNKSGVYNDTASDYQCNEVSIDYNATLVAAAAALYRRHIGEASQTIDPSLYVDNGEVTPDPTPTPEPQPVIPPDPIPIPGNQRIGTWFASYKGFDFYRDDKGDVRCYTGDYIVINDFKCDGTYTYYFQADCTAMKDRLTYHPDGVHIIYFDSEGHEVFSDFANVKKSIAGDPVDDLCFFNVYGYMYVDTLTYDKKGEKLYYVNPYGVIERKGWFAYSGHEFEAGLGFTGRSGGYGYGQSDGSLLVNTYTYDWDGNYVYIQGDGHMFR